MIAVAPGKLILSGEHAVVYQKPALTLAIDRHIRIKITESNNKHVTLSLLGKQCQFTFEALSTLKQHIDGQYRLFLNEKCKVTDILTNPEDLACYIIADVLENFSLKPSAGFNVNIRSNIPTGCGMGSSAALIVSLLFATKDYFKLDLADDRLMNHAIFLENLQHGRASGLDVRISMQGGCLYSNGENIVAKSLPKLPLYIVNTGRPVTSTGECVTKVAEHAENDALWQEFSTTTDAIKLAFTQSDLPSLQKHIKRNHQLLIDIGVVPTRIQTFISDIESAGSAAKICGAGAVRGDTAGVVLIATDNIATLKNVCKQHAFEYEEIIPQQKGAHFVS